MLARCKILIYHRRAVVYIRTLFKDFVFNSIPTTVSVYLPLVELCDESTI